MPGLEADGVSQAVYRLEPRCKVCKLPLPVRKDLDDELLEPVREPVRPHRSGALASMVAVASSVGVFAVGIYPPLLTHFPAVSTLIGR